MGLHWRKEHRPQSAPLQQGSSFSWSTLPSLHRAWPYAPRDKYRSSSERHVARQQTRGLCTNPLPASHTGNEHRSSRGVHLNKLRPQLGGVGLVQVAQQLLLRGGAHLVGAQDVTLCLLVSCLGARLIACFAACVSCTCMVSLLFKYSRSSANDPTTTCLIGAHTVVEAEGCKASMVVICSHSPA